MQHRHSSIAWYVFLFFFISIFFTRPWALSALGRCAYISGNALVPVLQLLHVHSIISYIQYKFSQAQWHISLSASSCRQLGIIATALCWKIWHLSFRHSPIAKFYLKGFTHNLSMFMSTNKTNLKQIQNKLIHSNREVRLYLLEHSNWKTLIIMCTYVDGCHSYRQKWEDLSTADMDSTTNGNWSNSLQVTRSTQLLLNN